MSKVDDVIALLHRDRRRLQEEQGRISRRNARRKVLGDLRSLRMAIDSEYPAVAKPPKPREDALTAASRKMSLHQFEHQMIRVRRPFDPHLAREFIGWFAGGHNLPMKKLSFDIRRDATLLQGEMTQTHIRLNPHILRTDRSKWRVFLHEMAHYRVGHHRRKFVLELAHVYREWKKFLVWKGF